MELEDHSFMSLLGRLAGNLIKDAFDEAGPDSSERIHQTRPLKWYESYLRRVLLAAGELVTTCEQIEQSVAFMSNFRSTPGLREKNITRLDHIQYHIENHLIRMISVGDRALILTSAVFRLGIKPENCDHRIIMNNEYVENTEVANGLKRISKVIQPYRKQRNEIVHQDTYSHEDMESLKAVYLLKKRGESPVPYHWTKRETDQFVAKRKKELVEVNNDLFCAVGDLFSGLEKVFRRKYPKLTA